MVDKTMTPFIYDNILCGLWIHKYVVKRKWTGTSNSKLLAYTVTRSIPSSLETERREQLAMASRMKRLYEVTSDVDLNGYVDFYQWGRSRDST